MVTRSIDPGIRVLSDLQGLNHVNVPLVSRRRLEVLEGLVHDYSVAHVEVRDELLKL